LFSDNPEIANIEFAYHKGEWQFAPAYDLTFSNSAYGFHSTMIAGESQNPERKQLMKLADHFSLKNAVNQRLTAFY